MADYSINMDLRAGYLDIPDVPVDSNLVGINPDKFPEIVRLTVFYSDIAAAREYLEIAKTLTKDQGNQREALYTAALLKLLTCFEATSGVRQQPLSGKRIYDPDQRARLKDLRLVRNRMVAHDEQLYGGVSILAAMNAQAFAQQIYALNMTFQLHTLVGWEDNLRELVEIASKWISDALHAEHQKAVEVLNGLPEQTRIQIRDSGEPTLNMRTVDGRWREDKKKGPAPGQ